MEGGISSVIHGARTELQKVLGVQRWAGGNRAPLGVEFDPSGGQQGSNFSSALAGRVTRFTGRNLYLVPSNFLRVILCLRGQLAPLGGQIGVHFFLRGSAALGVNSGSAGG